MRLFVVLLLCLAAVAFGADIARRSHGLSRIQATGGGGGTCAKESKDVNTCAKSLNKEPEDKDAVSYAKNQCLCFNRGRCANGKCVCMRSYQGTGQWCELDTDKPAKEKDVPDRGNNLNSRIKLGWEIEFPSNSINCAINNAGTLEQCQLTYKQKVDSKFEWDLTTDNSNNGAKPPPAVLTAIGLAPNYDTSGAEFPHTYGLEVKPSNPIVLANLKAAIINLAKLYDEMRTKDANGNNLPNVWMFDTPAPVTSYGFTWSDHSEVYTENGKVTRRVTRDGVAVPKKKYTSDAWKWGQLDYNTVYDKQTKNLRKFQNSRWWIDVGKGFAPSQNPPQITMGFIVSEFNPEKNDFLKHAMSSTNPSRIEGSKAHTLYQDLQQVDFGYGNEPNKIVRTWAQFVIYLAKRFQKDGIVAKQGFDPLFKADICVLTRHILNDLVDSSKKTQDVIATELISKLTPVLKLYGDDGAVKTEIQDRILKLAQENKSCRVAPGDTTVFPVEDLGNKDYIVVMEMRNPQGACVELVKYANLNLNKNRDDLDSKSLALFNKCWKDLQ